MEYQNTRRAEIALAALIRPLLLFSALLATLQISCLFYRSACTLGYAACYRNPPHEVFEDNPAQLSPTFINVGIYAFSAAHASSALLSARGDGIMHDDAFKPLYNSKLLDNKHLLASNAKLTKLWTSKEWRSKVSIFAGIFADLIKKELLKPGAKVLCIGARKGHEVLALKELGVYNSIGIDLVASPPLVMKGDIHSQPFGKDMFDFEFSSVFNHALLTPIFAAEIERTLKPGGCVVIHLMLKNPQSHKPKNLKKFDALVALFRNFEVVHVRDIEAFGLDTEVIFKKPFSVEIGKVRGSAHARE